MRQQAEQVFIEPGPATASTPDVEPLYAAIGRLQMENQLLKKRCRHVCSPAMHLGAGQEGSAQAHCQALGLARSSYYYQPREESPEILLLMRLLDERITADENPCFPTVL